jgi:SAM-dependent methyltransferase
MTTNRAEYDSIGDRYSEAKAAPWRIHLEAYTLEKLAGNVSGAQVLDLACGDGFYGRRLMKLGAAGVLGVDASAEMVTLGQRAEAAAPLGCRYLHADVNQLGVAGRFDVVVAAYLLNYASTREELHRFCEAMYANLGPGGHVVGVNDYTVDGETGERAFDRHGFRKIGPAPYLEGSPITYQFLLPGERSFAITNYYWTPKTYVDALAAAGFRDCSWHAFNVSPESRRELPPGFFDDLVARRPLAAYRARRP